ncbi:MAG: hypothetical protein M1825_004296 [Sarcosagium campestre]|nr:MAG: hypothetical protein M1825_004296 [Sarcosagium campestre]
MTSSNSSPISARPKPVQINSTSSTSPTQDIHSPRSPASPHSPTSPVVGSRQGYFPDIMGRITRSRSKSPSGRPTLQSNSMSNSPQPKSPTSRALSDPVIKNKRDSGTYTECGRHANEWLLGGFSVRRTVSRALSRDEPKSPTAAELNGGVERR